jgi:preprotein translocase subunit SecG
MYTFLIILFVLASFSMIIVILLQAGKGQGLAGAFGGGAGGAVFGGRGAATFLSKATTFLAVAYLVLCLAIGVVYKSQSETVRESLIQQEADVPETAPVTGVPVAPIPEQQSDSSK